MENGQVLIRTSGTYTRSVRFLVSWQVVRNIFNIGTEGAAFKTLSVYSDYKRLC